MNTWVNGGANLGANDFAISAFDTFAWSSPVTLTLTTRLPNHAPVLTGVNQNLALNQVVAAGSMWNVTDADSDPPFSFELYDQGSGGGSFRINGVAQPALTVIPITVGQLAQTDYRARASASAGAETLWARVYDGQAWSNWTSWNIAAA